LLRVSYVDALAITTTALPDAFLGHPYEVKLLHNFPTDAVVTYSLPCVKQAVKPGEFACTTAELKAQPPPGLVLTADGTIAGTPTSPAGSGAAASSTYSFLVKITDDQGRQDVRGLAIKVRPDYSLERTGCSGTGLDPSGLSVLLLAALALRRRRPSSSADVSASAR
jgi:hypothetical protein